MADNQNPSVSSLPTVCEVEEVLICLLRKRRKRRKLNNNNVAYEEQNPEYNLKKAKLLSSWMCDPQRTPNEIYELIGPKFEKLQAGSENKLTQAFLAAVVLDSFGVIYEREKIVLTGYWTKIVQCMIKYFYENEKTKDVSDFIYPNNIHLKESRWVLNACNADICPDNTLRLELFGLIWNMKYLNELTTEQKLEFFVRTISELDSDDIYNSHAHNFCFSADNLWVIFDKFGEKGKEYIGEKITESLMFHEVFGGEYNREVKVLQNLLKLTGILVKIARFRFQSESRSLRKWLDDCLTLFLVNFREFFKDGMKKLAQICLHPFIYPYYLDLVDNITRGILDLSGKLNKWRESTKLTRCRQGKFRRLETRRNYMVYCIDSLSPPMNLPPLLLKQELGILKPTGRAELQRKVFSQPNLPLSFNCSEGRIDISKYSDPDTKPQDWPTDANDEDSEDDDDIIASISSEVYHMIQNRWPSGWERAPPFTNREFLIPQIRSFVSINLLDASQGSDTEND